MKAFQETIEYCGLDDIGFKGPKFTWEGIRAGGAKIRCRLDRVLTNQNGQCLFPLSEVVVQNGPLSDQCALILHCRSKAAGSMGSKPFRFESMWLRHSDLQREVSKCWNVNSYGDGSIVQ